MALQPREMPEVPKPAETQTFHVLRAAGEMLHVAEPFLERNLHPTVIVRGMYRALEVRSLFFNTQTRAPSQSSFCLLPSGPVACLGGQHAKSDLTTHDWCEVR